MSALAVISGSAVPSRAIAIAERAPTLTLHRKREREWTAFGAISIGHTVTNPPSEQSVELPLPLAGEGWGGGSSASEVSVVDPKHPDWKVSDGLRTNARSLRKNSTDVERVLWSELRGHRLNGASFRRQVPIKNFIADFVCHAAKLVIEAQGFKVLRFSNHDVMENRAGVLETIAAAVAERAPTLTLPRKRERGQEKQTP